MALVKVERRGGAALIIYANPPLGTMTAAGSAEMLAAVRAAADDPAVRSIVLTGGLEGIFVRHYDVGELNVMGERLAGDASAAPPPQPVARGGGGFAELVDLLAAAPKPVI
jgi:enoyl-CoA hydratase/carnithine racemase